MRKTPPLIKKYIYASISNKHTQNYVSMHIMVLLQMESHTKIRNFAENRSLRLLSKADRLKANMFIALILHMPCWLLDKRLSFVFVLQVSCKNRTLALLVKKRFD